MTLKDFNHAHCIGIGGIGLSAVALVLQSRGIKVSGSDIKESAVTDQLRAEGITVYIGHAAENVEGADVLIYSAAVSSENPEVIRAKEMGIPIISRAEALGAIMQDYSVSVAVSGTHGKTTTTSMVSLILRHAGLDPTILVGGMLDEIGGNTAVGHSDYFVTEACEYMDSFLQLRPTAEIILNIDSDHLDYFKDIHHIAESFRTFAENVPEGGMIVAYDSNPFVNSVTENLNCRVVRFGFNENSDYYAKNISFNDAGMPAYDLYTKDGFACNIQLAIPGEHNVADSLAALATCLKLGVSLESAKETIEGFKGTQRRFDIIGHTKKGALLIDDYAHHPTEIKATLSAALKMPHKKLWLCFQSHTYTRTLALLDEFADAFQGADVLLIADIFAAREKNIYKISGDKIREAVLEKHPEQECLFIPEFEDMADYLLENVEEGDMIITMGAGDIYKVGEMILEKGGRA